MSTVDRADERSAASGSASADAILRHGDEIALRVDGAGRDATGEYLTDEVFLYRIAGFVAGEADGTVEVEDCYALDVVRVPVSGLRARRLRVVTPSAD